MSGVKLNVRGDVQEVRRDLLRQERKVLPNVVASSLNTTARTIRTRGLRRLSSMFNVSTRVLGKRARLHRAKRFKWTALILLNKTPINPARELAARETRAGVAARGKIYPGAFLAKGRGTTQELVFTRRTQERLPLKAEKIHIVPRGTSTFDRLTRRTSGRVFKKTFAARLQKALRKRSIGSTTVRSR